MTVHKSSLFSSIAVGAAAAFFGLFPVCDGDIFWHLAAGREMVRTHAFMRIDPFAFTSENLRWIDCHWLFQVCMYAVHALAGLKGILLANSLCVGLAAGLLFFISAPSKAPVFAAGLWIAALYQVRYLAPHRPIMVSLLLLAAFLACLEYWSRSGKRRYLLFLVPLQILWANVQPLFVLGPAMAFAWFSGGAVGRPAGRGGGQAGGLRQFLAGIAVSCGLCAVSLVNPYGRAVFSQALMLYGRIDPSAENLFALTIPENRPLLWMIGTPEAHYVWATLAVTACALLLAALRPRSAELPYLFVAGALFFLAFRAQRNIILYFFGVLPLINLCIRGAREAVQTWPEKTVRRITAGLTAAAGAGALFACGSHAFMLENIRAAGSVAPFSFPVKSVEYLVSHEVPGALFNADRYGGYILWKDFPKEKVFIDTRYAIRPPGFLRDYCTILDHPGLFDGVCRNYGITKAVMPAALVDRYFSLERSLLASPEWRLAYADGAEVLFVKNRNARPLNLDKGEAVDSVARAIAERWRNAPVIRREGLAHWAEFLSAMGKEAGAARAFSLLKECK